MGVPVIDTGPFTVEEFYAFTDARPDHEKWELIDGELILNASPAFLHQKIIGNILVELATRSRELGETWFVIPGIGALVSDTSRPEPDVMLLPRDAVPADPRTRDTRDAGMLQIPALGISLSLADIYRDTGLA